MNAPAAPPSPTTVAAATRATYAAFICLGFNAASLAGRIPQIRDHLHLDPSNLGFVLLAMAIGAVVSLPASGPLVTRFGTRRVLAAMAGMQVCGIVIVAIGYLVSIWILVVGFLVLGLSVGPWDVAMNVHGTVVERRLGRAIMARFHAGYSVGTVGGAVVAVVIVALGVPVPVHLLVVSVVTASMAVIASRDFLADLEAPGSPPESGTPTTEPTTARHPLGAWLESRTILIGLFVLAFTFAEGAGNDWISVSVIDGYHAAASVAVLMYACFLAAMTAVRWFGPGLLDRYGRVPVLRTLALVAALGLLLFIYGPTIGTAVAGAVLWGAGVSLGFPVGMSAAADEPARAAARVSVVASIGYCAFLTGPPLIGFLGDHLTVLRALSVIAVLLMGAVAIASATRPLEPAAAESDDTMMATGATAIPPLDQR